MSGIKSDLPSSFSSQTSLPGSSLLSLPPHLCAVLIAPFLTYGDADRLRLTCSELAEVVRAAPLVDVATLVEKPSAWRRAFPRACAVSLSPKAANLPGLAETLNGVLRVAVLGRPRGLDASLAALLPPAATTALAQHTGRRRRALLVLDGGGGG